MNIRRIKSSEIEFLSEMLYEAIFVPEGQDPLPKEVIRDASLAKYIEHWGRDPYDIAFVAEIDNQLVGAAWGRLFSEENKGFGFVDHQTPELSMAVRPDYRNRGIGTNMMKAIHDAYSNLGVARLSLSVDKANNATHLYRRLGYETVEETETSLTMKKAVD